MTRPLYDLAAELEAAWQWPPSAQPYLRALYYLECGDDRAGAARGEAVVRVLLTMSHEWVGVEAERYKKLLRESVAVQTVPSAPKDGAEVIEDGAAVCSNCGADTEGKFVRGSMVSGAKGDLCLPCHMFFGVGLGLDHGKLYVRRDNGRWERLSSGGFKRTIDQPPSPPRRRKTVWSVLKEIVASR